jgi:hypothetical protein
MASTALKGRIVILGVFGGICGILSGWRDLVWKNRGS